MPNDELVNVLTKVKWLAQRMGKEVDELTSDLERSGHISLIRGTWILARLTLLRNLLTSLNRETQLQIQRETR